MTETQLLDAIAVGQVTPGPVFTTATFIGYVLAGPKGATVATVGISLPAFLFVAVSGPLVPRIRRSRTAGAFLDGANAAALALMVVVAYQLGRARSSTSLPSHWRPVSRKTVLLMVKPDLLERAMHGSYSFCSSRDCLIVYFEGTGSQQFTVDDLRIRVGVKVNDDPIPLCYCFGFDENHIRDEIERTGNTSIPDKVSGLIREGLCACEARNPAGVCCLGELHKAAKHLKLELAETQNG